MLYAYNEKRRNDGRKGTIKQGKIRMLREKETNKYLKIGSNHHQTSEDERKKLKKEYVRRTRKLFETTLNSRDPKKGINTWAVAFVRNSEPFLKWTREEIKQMNQRIGKLMTMHQALHARDDVDSRKGGRRFASIENSVDSSIQRLEDKIEKCGERLIRANRNNKENTRIKRTNVTRKQKWEEKRATSHTRKHVRGYERETLSEKLNLFWLRNNAVRTSHIMARIDKTQ